MTKQTETKQELTPEEVEIKKIKKKYNLSEVYKLEVPKDDTGDEFVVGYLKKPNRATMAAVMSLMASDKIGAAFDTILNTCLLKEESDPLILEDDEIYWGAVACVKQLITIRKGQLKKY